MSHLDDKSKMDESERKRKKPVADAKVRTGIVNVLANIVSIAAGESIGMCSLLFVYVTYKIVCINSNSGYLI